MQYRRFLPQSHGWPPLANAVLYWGSCFVWASVWLGSLTPHVEGGRQGRHRDSLPQGFLALSTPLSRITRDDFSPSFFFFFFFFPFLGTDAH
jgi:hypothetical protein